MRFQRNRQQFVDSKGERFCRMWEFYLVSCQTAFEVSNLVVLQWLLSKDIQAVPITETTSTDESATEGWHGSTELPPGSQGPSFKLAKPTPSAPGVPLQRLEASETLESLYQQGNGCAAQWISTTKRGV